MGRLANLLRDMIITQFNIIPRNVYYLDPVDGRDTNSGLLETAAFQTLPIAYAACESNYNDCIIWIAKNSSGSIAELSAGLDWAKSFVHLFGFCPPVLEGKRSRITQKSDVTGISPLLKVSGSNNIFSNLRIIQEVADATSLIDVEVTGERNYFKNVEFGGIAHATMSAPGACSLKLNAGAENLFEDCVIGLDTIARDADATEILFDTAATRNTFKNCIVKSYISAAGFASVTIADSTGIDRAQYFENCQFITDSTNQAVTQTEVFKIPAMVQGKIVLKNCSYLTDGASGSGCWESNGRGLIWNNTPAAAAAGAGGEMTKL